MMKNTSDEAVEHFVQLSGRDQAFLGFVPLAMSRGT